MTLAACLLVLVGGFFGGIARYFVSGFVGRRVGETFPWGTLVVNVSGALAIGALAGLARVSGGVFASELFRDFVFWPVRRLHDRVLVLPADAQSRSRG